MISLTVKDDSAVDRLEGIYNKWDATMIRGANHLAETFASQMRSHIRNREFNVPDKSGTWHSYDSRPLINLGNYVDSIKSIGPGVACDTVLMNRLEHGTRTQAPRPHWGPLLRQFSRFQIKAAGEQMLYELHRY